MGKGDCCTWSGCRAVGCLIAQGDLGLGDDEFGQGSSASSQESSQGQGARGLKPRQASYPVNRAFVYYGARILGCKFFLLIYLSR